MDWFTKQAGWVKVVLVGSLALNLFLGGFIVARVLKPQSQLVRPVVALNLQSVPDGLRGEALERIEDAMHERRHELRRVYSDYRQTRRDAVRLLGEVELNEEALRQVYEQMRELSVRIQEPIHGAVIEALKGVDVMERRRILRAQRLRHPHPVRRVNRIDGNRWYLEFRDGDIELNFDDLFDENNEDGREQPQ
ncbi:MAG: periplasmic heavy metal sensor [Proteobacteria bacterium]|nr:periplasmic heavy metal sensor [Pseudomonadota bacterium]